MKPEPNKKITNTQEDNLKLTTTDIKLFIFNLKTLIPNPNTNSNPKHYNLSLYPQKCCLANIRVTTIDTILSSWSSSTLRSTPQKSKHSHFTPHACFIGLTPSHLVKLLREVLSFC